MASPASRAKISAAPSRHVYDVIVLGGQLGGPLSAALLQKRGYRVLYVEHDGLGHGYEHGGYVLPYAPFVAPPLKTMPTVEEVLLELGVNTTVHRALKLHQPELQLVFDRHRLDLHGDAAKRKAELVREFGAAGAKTNDAVAKVQGQFEPSNRLLKEVPDLPPVGWFGRWKTRRALSQHSAEIDTGPALGDSEPPAALLRKLLPFVTWLEKPGAPLAETRPLSQVLSAPSRYPGGREGLRELLLKRLQDLGGHVLSPETTDAWVVEELSFEGGKLVGIGVLQSSNVYKASALVAATDAGALRRLVHDKKRQRALTEMLDLVETKQFLFSVNWVVPVDLLPRGMGELLLLETGDDLETLLVQVHPARKQGGEEDPSVRVVCAGAFVPASTRELGEPRLEALKKQIEGHLERLMPFAKEKLALSSAPYLDAGGVRGSRLLPHPLLQIDVEQFAGITGLPPRTPVKNLFLASREVLPGLGLEGELLAGVRAARLVHDLLHKKKAIKR